MHVGLFEISIPVNVVRMCGTSETSIYCMHACSQAYRYVITGILTTLNPHCVTYLSYRTVLYVHVVVCIDYSG